MSANKWEACTALAPTDTIAGLEFSRRNLLSCISWDGSLSIVDPLNPVSVYKTTQSRPLLAQSWEQEGRQLWYGGGEARISYLNLDKMVSIDHQPCRNALFALKAIEAADHTLVAADAEATFVVDSRCVSRVTSLWKGARSVDAHDNRVLATNGDECAMFDIRYPGRQLRSHSLAANANALSIKWLDADKYALADKCSRVHIYSLSTDSFAFYSNRLSIKSGAGGDTRQATPIYALSGVSGISHQLATGGGDRHVYVWDYERRSLQAKMRFPMPCLAIAYSRWGNLMAVGLSNDDWSVTNAQYARPSRAKVVLARIR